MSTLMCITVIYKLDLYIKKSYDTCPYIYYGCRMQMFKSFDSYLFTNLITIIIYIDFNFDVNSKYLLK